MSINNLREEVLKIESILLALSHYAEGGPDGNDQRGHIEFIVLILAKQGRESVGVVCEALEVMEAAQLFCSTPVQGVTV